MRGLAQEMMRHHGAPLPAARFEPGVAFPGAVFRRLAAGAGIGGLLGLLLGTLLYQGIVIIPRVEELYSMGPAAFHLFWIFMGISAGTVCSGTLGIITIPD